MIRAFLALVALYLSAQYLAVARPIDWTQFAVGGAIGAIVILIGLACAWRFEKGTAYLGGERAPLSRLFGALLVGAVVGAIILGILLYVVAPIEPGAAARLAARANDPIWRPLALAYESSILEEFALRLFLMSVVIWLFSAGWKKTTPSPLAVTLGVIVSVAVFAAIHLPAWLQAVDQPSVTLLAAVLGLNAIAGVAFSVVYWRNGIEAALLCHFAGDMVVQTIGPRLV